MQFTPITNTVQSMGLTRDSAIWFWGRLTSGALLVVSGVFPLDSYFAEGSPWPRVITVGAAIVLWLSGRYDSSPLPGAPKH